MNAMETTMNNTLTGHKLYAIFTPRVCALWTVLVTLTLAI